MRQAFFRGWTSRVWLVAAVTLAGAAGWLIAQPQTASAYSGSQAEAQSDPSADPYSFPNIKLCCKPKKKARPVNRPWMPWPPYGQPAEGRPWPERWVRVSCGAPVPRSFSSIEDALEHVGEGGGISVVPGAPCSIAGLSLDRSIVVESDREFGSGRATLISGPCAIVSGPYASSVVTMRGVDIEGCLTVKRGRLDLDEVNVTSRGNGAAIYVSGASLSLNSSTVRAMGRAIETEGAHSVTLTASQVASNARAEHTVRLSVGTASIRDSLIKGGQTGIAVQMSGRYPVSLRNVQVLRGDAGEVARTGPGKAGILVGGVAFDDQLPTLPSLPGAEVSVEGGTVGGYIDGIVFGSGAKGGVKGATIAYPGRGIVVQAGATVNLADNRISKVRVAGISLEKGAQGSATFNTIQCDSGECVCYGGECTSRAAKDFGGFKMSGTDCDD